MVENGEGAEFSRIQLRVFEFSYRMIGKKEREIDRTAADDRRRGEFDSAGSAGRGAGPVRHDFESATGGASGLGLAGDAAFGSGTDGGVGGAAEAGAGVVFTG